MVESYVTVRVFHARLFHYFMNMAISGTKYFHKVVLITISCDDAEWTIQAHRPSNISIC